MSFSSSLYGVINARWIRHFLARRIRKISLPMARFLQYGRTDLNIKSYWDRLWSMGVIQGMEEQRYGKLTEKITEFVRTGSRVLDVGCGSGRLMRSLRENKHCDCVGLDISEIAISMTRNSGFEAYLSKLPDLPPEIRDMQFDVVTAVEVFEHISQIDKTLIALNRIIKPGGQLIASVPNNCMPPELVDEHQHIFTETSLRALVEKYFEVERCMAVASGSEQYLVTTARRGLQD
jgi:2-polyprenyl-3-methyl-5-hydroxy-6-metoxy-1,4-benzoquinol methylase